MTFEDKQIVANSIRITGNLRVAPGSSTDALQQWFLDSNTAIHGAFQGITSSCDELGVIENANEYPRWIKAKTGAIMTRQQRVTDSLNVTELRGAADSQMAAIVTGYDHNVGQDFSFKPEIACRNEVWFRQHRQHECQPLFSYATEVFDMRLIEVLVWEYISLLCVVGILTC